MRLLLGRVGSLALVMAIAILGPAAGCAQTPLPAVLAAPTRQSCGNPCATLNCPSAYTCRVDANCSAHCEPERVGDKIF